MKHLFTRKLMLLVAMLLAGMGGTFAFEYEGLTYRVIDNNAKTVKVSYQGNDIMYSDPYTQSSIVIPETVSYNGNTYTVVEIGDNAFQNAALSSITIPTTVKTIGSSAFMNCQNLVSIDLSGIETFGTHIFSTCTSLTTVKLPETLHSIPDAMFSMCSNITDFSFDNITSIGYSSFEGTGLTDVTLSCYNIGMNAFANCKKLTKITLLGSFLSMVDNQFWGCDNVKTFICFVRSTGNFGFSDDVKETAKVIVPESQVSNWTGSFLNVEVANISNVGGHVIDVPGGYYDINSYVETGHITINGKSADSMYGQTFIVNPSTDVEVGFVPNNDMSWELETATINGTDVTSSLVNGKYTIKSISGNQLINATWKQGVTYNVTYYASDYSCGSLFINDKELSMYSNTAAFPGNQNIKLLIKPNAGYSISYFRIDAMDKKNELTANADGTYSYTHYLYGDTSVEIGYEKKSDDPAGDDDLSNYITIHTNTTGGDAAIGWHLTCPEFLFLESEYNDVDYITAHISKIVIDNNEYNYLGNSLGDYGFDTSVEHTIKVFLDTKFTDISNLFFNIYNVDVIDLSHFNASCLQKMNNCVGGLVSLKTWVLPADLDIATCAKNAVTTIDNTVLTKVYCPANRLDDYKSFFQDSDTRVYNCLEANDSYYPDKEGESGGSTWKLTTTFNDGGTVTVDGENVMTGTTKELAKEMLMVQVNIRPNTGYELASVLYNSIDVTTTWVSDMGDGSFTIWPVSEQGDSQTLEVSFNKIKGFTKNVEINGIYYDISEADGINRATVTGNNGSISDIVIPEIVEDDGEKYSVTSIGDYAFNGSSITSVTIPNSVTSIGAGAFSWCGSISSITIPSSVKITDNTVFEECSNLNDVKVVVMDYSEFCNNQILSALIYREEATNVSFSLFDTDGNEITEYIIPDGVTTIGNAAFKRCTRLTSVTIPSSVKTIGNGAFFKCSGLTSITIPNSVTSIGDQAFYDCTGLRLVKSEISTPFDVNAFGMSDLYYDPSQWSWVDDAILVVPKGSRTAYRSVSGWREFAFTYEEGETIYDRGQTDDQGLYYALRQADDYSFYYEVTDYSNKSNTEIVIPVDLDGIPVRSVYKSCFRDCQTLTKITIPGSVTLIDYSDPMNPTDPWNTNSIFLYGCINLKDVNVVVTDYSEFCNNTVLREFNTPLSYRDYERNEDIRIDYSIHLIDTDGNEITEYIIPDGVTSIGGSAFKGCTGLTSITIPNSVTSIGDQAFYDCTGLRLVKSEISAPFDVNAFGVSDDPYNPATPPDLMWTWLDNAILVVPKGSRDAYKSVNGWRGFAYTYEEGEAILDRGQTDDQGIHYTLKQADDCSFYYAVTGYSDKLNSEIVIPADLGGIPVRSVYKSCFRDRQTLTKITIPGNVTLVDAEIDYSDPGYTDPWNTNNIFLYGCINLKDVNIVVMDYSEFCNNTILREFDTPLNYWDYERNEDITIDYTVHLIDTDGNEITDYIIPDGVTSIGESAFKGYTGLTSITIPNSVTTIEYYAFANCSNLASVKMGENVISIGSGAFSGCNLTFITLSNKLEYIGTYAFDGDGALTSITIPNSVTFIGEGAFRGCSSLTSVTIPSSVTDFDASAFWWCDNWREAKVVVTDYSEFCNNKILGSLSNPSHLIDTHLIDTDGNEITEYIIPDGVTTIGELAFKGLANLTSIIIPNSVTSIGGSAFEGCSGLTFVKLPESLTTIGDGAFKGCSLTSIELPNSFTIIPDGLFSDFAFHFIKLGNNVKSIGKNAFGSSDLVIEIGTSTPPTIANDAFPNVMYLSDINVIVPDAAAETAYRKAAVWKEMTFTNLNNISEVTVDAPGDLSFELITECGMQPAKVVGLKVNGKINADDFTQMLVNMKSLLRLDLSDCDITEIPEGALKGKIQLQELTLPAKLQTIGNGAFQGCTYLQKLTLQTGLQTIGNGAFQNCISLKELTLPTGFQTIIGQGAFSGCTSLQELTLQTGLQTIGQEAFYGCISLTGELDLPSTVTTIGASAFVSTKFTSVKLPSALKTISDYAFNNVPIKQKLTLPGKVTSVGAYAFAGTKIQGLSIPDGVTSIGDYAFADTPIQGHVTIPDGVTYLGTGAFRNTQLSTVFLPNSITSLSEGLFQGCPNLDIVYIPDNYTSVSSSAFDGCASLAILRLSANLASMGTYAFQNTPLEYIKVPSKVEVLSKGVLKNCRNLVSLSLPANLKTVDDEALIGCTALRNLSVEAIEPPAINNRSAIRGINTDLCLISIPTQSYRAYVLAEYWGQFVQMRNDIAVETEGDGEIAFESVEEGEEEVSESRRRAQRSAAARSVTRAQFATDEESMTFANNGSSVYVPKEGKVRFYIIPGEGEELLSATLDGKDIMPDIVDGVYTATADKKNAKLMVKFSGSVMTPGDANGDGTVNAADIVEVVNYIMGHPSGKFKEDAADANGDNVVNAADIVAIVNIIMGN